MPIVNVFVPTAGIDRSLVTADSLRTRTAAPDEATNDGAQLDCLAMAIRNEWRLIGHVNAAGHLYQVELVKWFRDLDTATSSLAELNRPKESRFYIRTTDDQDARIITNVIDQNAADKLYDPDTPALGAAPQADQLT